jgi:type IV pilus assembly protein PilM
MAFHDNDYFGLDLGSSGIRVVQLRAGGGGNPALVTYGEKALDQALVTSDSTIDQEKVATAVHELVTSLGINSRKVVASIPAEQAFATVITTPKLSPEELDKAMKLQADQYIPMAAGQAKVDWQVIGQGKTDAEMQVLLVAAPNSVITRLLNIVEKAGLELQSVEINGVAAARSLVPVSDLAVALLDLGAASSEIAIVHQGSPKLIRSVNVGGTTLMRSVSEALGLDEVQAQQFMEKFGFTQTKLEGQVAKAMKSSFDLLVSELDKSIKFFGTQNEGVKLEKIVLTGPTSLLPEFGTAMANATNLPVQLGNPWGHVSYPAAQQDTLAACAPRFAVAVGLAERAYV